MSISFQKQKDPMAKLDFPFDIPRPLISFSWPHFDSISQWSYYFFFLPTFPRPFIFCCINSTKQTNKHLHLITSLKPILKVHKINLCKTNNLRDPSLRAGRLDPITLKIGSDVSLSFDLPNYQNTGDQHNGDHGGTLSKIFKTKHSLSSIT